MIKIDKSVDVPAVLANKGKALRQITEACYDDDPDGNTVSKKLKYAEKIYGHDTVKGKLRECQYNKCCYSESKFAGDYPHVEHFRPKGRVNAQEVLYPGYYWLAFEWENLFLSKSRINVTHKKNFFPLEDESKRARNHHHDIANEVPLLINPGKEDPREHIRFHMDEPIAYNNSRRGQETIKLLGLRHPELQDARQGKIKLLSGLKIALTVLLDEGFDKNNTSVINIQKILSRAILPEAEFSSMAIDYLS